MDPKSIAARRINQPGPVGNPTSDGLQRALLGLVDARGPMGQYARGTNVYNGVSNAPHTGKAAQTGFVSNSRDLRRQQTAQRLMQTRRRAKINKKQLVGGFDF